MTKKPASLTSQLLVRKGDATPVAVPDTNQIEPTAPAEPAEAVGGSSASGSAASVEPKPTEKPQAEQPADPVFAATPNGMQPAQEPTEEQDPVRPEPEIVMEPAPEKKSSNKIAYIGGFVAIVVGVLVALNFFGTDKSGTSVAPLAKTTGSNATPTFSAAKSVDGESASVKTLTPYTDAARGKVEAQIEPTDPAIDDAVKALVLRPSNTQITEVTKPMTTGPASSVAPVTFNEGEVVKTIAKATPAKAPVAQVAAPIVTPVKTAKIETPTAAPVAHKGQYLIQLFSVRSEKDAKRGWAKTQSKHKTLLSNEALNLEKADLGERGIYYRVRFGAYDTSSAANSVCSALKKEKQDCLVKKLR